MNAEGNLVSINERTKIYRENDKIIYEENERKYEVPETSKASMNFWGFHHSVFPYIEKLFQSFLKNHGIEPKAEFFIPIVGDEFIKDGKGIIKVIPTAAQWFGVTYKEDAPTVKKDIQILVDAGEYPPSLWK